MNLIPREVIDLLAEVPRMNRELLDELRLMREAVKENTEALRNIRRGLRELHR